MAVGRDWYEGRYTAAARFEGSGDALNPEELIGAAHAGCFSMALSADLGRAGYSPERVHTTADVDLEEDPNGGWHIATITLRVDADVPEIDASEFEEIAAQAKDNCPVSKALGGVNIKLETTLNG